MALKSRWLEGYSFEGVPGKITLEGMKKEGAGQQDEASVLGVDEGGAARWGSGMLLEGLDGHPREDICCPHLWNLHLYYIYYICIKLYVINM